METNRFLRFLQAFLELLIFSFCLLKDIGRTTSGPQINPATGEVFITYVSSTQCAADPAQNYTSTIIFTCRRGLALVSPHLLRDAFTYTSSCSLKDFF